MESVKDPENLNNSVLLPNMNEEEYLLQQDKHQKINYNGIEAMDRILVGFEKSELDN